MKKIFEKLLKRTMPLMALLLAVQTAGAAYKISCWRTSGGTAHEAEFVSTGNGTQMRATVTLSGYTGNTSDYSFWVGNGGWEEGRSEVVNLADYLGSCLGAFTIDIWTDSSDKNYYPNNAQDACSCNVPAAGSSIPANTVIYFDNTKTNWSAVFVSVAGSSANASSQSIESGSYTPSSDTFYAMTRIDGTNIWKGTIVNANSRGRISFWSTNMSLNSEAWKTSVILNRAYSGSYDLFTPTSSKCYVANRQTTVYTDGSWSTYASVNLSSSTSQCIAGETSSIILKASKSEAVSGSSYIWQKSTNSGSTFTTIATTAADTYELSGSNIPTCTTIYRCVVGTTTSNNLKVTYINICADASKSSKNIFIEDFGTLPDLKSRATYSYINSSYINANYPYKVNDGNYAVVATPYYCGCGTGDGNSVEDCMGNNMWFRSDLRDHTMDNQTSTGPFGAMLLLNYSTNKADSVALVRELTTAETQNFVAGANLVFSAWFAYPAPKSHIADGNVVENLPVDMALIIQQYKGSKWVNVSKVVSTVRYEDGWTRSAAELDITDTGAKYRIMIINNAAGGTGNDVLIDDISLDICIPKFNIELYDAEKGPHSSEEVTSVGQSLTTRIKYDSNWGLGATPQVLMFQIDTTKAIGSAGRYKYTGVKMTRSGDYYTSTFKASDYFTTIPDEVDLTGVVIESSEDVAAIAAQIESGALYPGKSTSYLFARSYVSFTINCAGNITFWTDGEQKAVSVCSDGSNLPSVVASFTKVTTDDVTYELLEGSTVVASGSAAASPISIDLKTLTLDKSAGAHQFSFRLYEHYNGEVVCARYSLTPITITFVDAPVITGWVSPYTVCKGKTAEIAVNAKNVVGYQWQMYSEGVWSDITGAQSSKYTVPATLTADTDYRVVLSSTYCSPVSSDKTTVKLEICEDINVVVEPGGRIGTSNDVNHFCGNDTVSFKTMASNDASYPAATKVTLGYTSESMRLIESKPSVGTVTGNVWDCGTLPAGGHATLERIYVITVNGPVTVVDSSYVSLMASETYTGYDDVNLKATMKGRGSADVDPKTETPQGLSVNPVYDECPMEGTILLEHLVVTNKDNLLWYDEDGVPVTFNSFNAATPQNLELYVTNQQDGGYCISDTATVQIVVRNNSAVLSTTDYEDECPVKDKSINLEDFILTSDYGTLTWYDEEGVVIGSTPVVDVSVADLDKVYYVTQTKSGECESASKAAIRVMTKNRTGADDIVVASQTRICKDGTATLTASSSVVSGATFRWYSDAALTALIATGPSITTPSLSDNVTYYVTAENSNYCENAADNGAVASVFVMDFAIAPEAEGYSDKCPVDGLSFPAEDLITSSHTDALLLWYDAAGNSIEAPVIDGSQPQNVTYYVSAIREGQCESKTRTEIPVYILNRAVESDINVIGDGRICSGDNVELKASSTTVTSSPEFNWYADADLTELLHTGAVYNVDDVRSSVTYYVTVNNANYCENLAAHGQTAAVNVAGVAIASATLTKESEEIGLGSESDKTLTVEPADATYTAEWIVNDQRIDDIASFLPHKPYVDQFYKVILTDGCRGTKIELNATTTVKWPTLITPYNNDGFNDDFVTGMDEPFAITVLDRYGDKVYEGPDGWPQDAAANKMPGVYYYIVVLPDGTVRKGAIEIYK